MDDFSEEVTIVGLYFQVGLYSQLPIKNQENLQMPYVEIHLDKILDGYPNLFNRHAWYNPYSDLSWQSWELVEAMTLDTDFLELQMMYWESLEIKNDNE